MPFTGYEIRMPRQEEGRFLYIVFSHIDQTCRDQICRATIIIFNIGTCIVALRNFVQLREQIYQYVITMSQFMLKLTPFRSCFTRSEFIQYKDIRSKH